MASKSASPRTCAQADFGKCGRPWLDGFCTASCGGCDECPGGKSAFEADGIIPDNGDSQTGRMGNLDELDGATSVRSIKSTKSIYQRNQCTEVDRSHHA